ncbi:SIMPL domain-containing protein [Sandaracinus amylolyticus]|uniref:SIMPL domain-containing protein n=1 Tax=Sandaracinus amylolyticus TaxID=927083 RepID=UPI001F3238A3|nr:SIMPL domain-containing protein [Sandaracinus amylolyticus]UJR78479.1 Hypothetical protein I5071_5090 [Sandaracinus amylolyticus]
MKRLIGIAALLGLAACAHPGAASTTLVREDVGIQVTGQGESEARPDLAVVRVGIESRRPSVAEARESAAQATSAMIAALRGAGIAEDRVQTASLSITPEYEYTEQGQRLLGYTARNQLEVRITEIDRAGEVIDAAVGAGGDQARLESVTLEVTDPSAARAEARREAMDAARRDASQLAELAGVELGAPIAIEETIADEGPRPFAARMEAADAATTTPVQPGTTRIRVHVRVRYAVR